MSQISVISKLTGVETTTEGTQITLDHSSIVKLNVDRADISGYSRSGNDLVITLHSGEVITLKNFYVTDAQGVSQLVLEESDGALWWIEDPTGAATYESIASTDALLAASGSDTAAPQRGPGCWVAWPSQVGLPLRQEPAVEVAGMTITTARIPAIREILPSQIPRLRMPPPIYRSHLTAKPSPVPLSRAARLP